MERRSSVPYRVLLSELAARRLADLDEAALSEWRGIELTLTVIPYPQVRDRRIRRFRLADDAEVFLYAIPAFPFTIAYTIDESQRATTDGVVTIRAFLDR